MDEIVYPFYGYSETIEFSGSWFDILLGVSSIYQRYKDVVYFPMRNNAIAIIQ